MTKQPITVPIMCILLVAAAGCKVPAPLPVNPAIADTPPIEQPTQPALVAPTLEKSGEPSATPAPPQTAGVANADVQFVRAVRNTDGAWTFHVTVRHPDTGWKDYADGWDVVLPDGMVIKPDADSPFTRLLTHPHETEQPFTRSQSGIRIPEDVSQVRVRAHDLVDGWGGREVVVDLAVASGQGYSVERPD